MGLTPKLRKGIEARGKKTEPAITEIVSKAMKIIVFACGGPRCQAPEWALPPRMGAPEEMGVDNNLPEAACTSGHRLEK